MLPATVRIPSRVCLAPCFCQPWNLPPSYSISNRKVAKGADF